MSLSMHGLVRPFRWLYEALKRPSGAFLTSAQEALGVYPEISFRTMTQVYLADLAARASIDFLADQIVGAGFHTTMSEGYAEKREGETAKDVVDDFCEEANLDVVLQDTAKYLVGWGNAFWWVGNSKRIEFLRLVPIETIVKIHFSGGELERLVLDWHRKPREILGDELIHLAYNQLTAEPLGIGILYSLCAPLSIGNGETREPFFQIKGKIHKGMAEVIYNWGAPNELWVLPDLSKARLDEAHRAIKSLPMKGARFTTTVKDARVQPIVAERMRGLDFYVETLEDEFVLGLETPLAKLVTKTGFTEASANAALEIAERRVMALQRFIKRSVERHLFDRVIEQAGLDPVQAQVRLNWGLPEKPEIEALLPILAQIATARPDIISPEEFRDILIDLGLSVERRKMTTPLTPIQTKPPQAPVAPESEKPVVSAQKNVEVMPGMVERSRFLLKESPDWCADAGGHWITHEGKHLCVDIENYQKVPKEIRDEVAQGEKDYQKVSARPVKAAKYRKRKKLAHKLTSIWSDKPEIRAGMDKELQRYEPEHLEIVRRIGVGSTSKGSAAIYGWDGRFGEIIVRPDYADDYRYWLHHEMGHHIAQMTEGTTKPDWCRKYLVGESKTKFREFLGSYGVEKISDLYAEAWAKMMQEPEKVRKEMKRDEIIKEFYTTLQQRSGYKIRTGKREGEDE